MQQSQDDPEFWLIAASVARASAEHVEWARMLDHAERLEADYSQTAEYFHRQAQLMSIPLEIGVAMTMSEGQVRRVLSAAERLRTEADLFNERAENERSQRRVEVDHGDDAMSWLNAYLPAHVAAAVDKRLTFEARRINDGRTMAQKRSDLLACWLTTNEHGEIALGADIAVIIDAETLLGHNEEPAVAADGSFVVPAKWVTDSATNPFWHSILTGKGGNVLEHRYHGRFAPDILKKALIFTCGVRDATTVRAQRGNAPGRSPAAVRNERLELRGTSSAHHQMKSHRVITWTMGSGRTIDAEPTQHAA